MTPPRVTIGSAARNRPTCGLTILLWGKRDDLRDLWNQQTPFAIAEELKPVFRKRLVDSLTNWDMRDGKADWTPAELAASANVYLDDFLLFDVSKPINDESFFEIEKSTLGGKRLSDRRGPYCRRERLRHDDDLDGEQRPGAHARRRGRRHEARHQ